MTDLIGPDVWQETKAWAPTFDDFWEKSALAYAEDFAAREGLAEACRARGLNGLLKIRAVRLGVGIALSLVFSQVVESRKPHKGDGYDMWHAVVGSAADIFVTFDERFANHLGRIPMDDGFRVVTALPALLG